MKKTNWRHVCLWFTIRELSIQAFILKRLDSKHFFLYFTRNNLLIYRPKESEKSVGMSHSYSSSLPQVFQKFLVWQCNAVIEVFLEKKKISSSRINGLNAESSTDFLVNATQRKNVLVQLNYTHFLQNFSKISCDFIFEWIRRKLCDKFFNSNCL